MSENSKIYKLYKKQQYCRSFINNRNSSKTKETNRSNLTCGWWYFLQKVNTKCYPRYIRTLPPSVISAPYRLSPHSGTPENIIFCYSDNCVNNINYCPEVLALSTTLILA